MFSNVTVACQAGAILSSVPGQSYNIFAVKASGFAMRNCTIDMSGTEQPTAIGIYPPGPGISIDSEEIAGNIFKGDKTNGIAAVHAVGNYSERSAITGLTISQNRVVNGNIFGQDGLARIHVMGNDVTNRPTTGQPNAAIAFHTEGNGASIEQVSISGNTIHNQGQFCTELQGFYRDGKLTGAISQVSFENNRCEDVAPSVGGGYSFDSVTGLTAKANTFDSNGADIGPYTPCLELVKGSDAKVTGMSCRGSSISVNKQSRTQILSSTSMVSGARQALYIGGTSDAGMKNNNSDNVLVKDSSFECKPCMRSNAVVWIQANGGSATARHIEFVNDAIVGSGSGVSALRLSVTRPAIVDDILIKNTRFQKAAWCIDLGDGPIWERSDWKGIRFLNAANLRSEDLAMEPPCR